MGELTTFPTPCCLACLPRMNRCVLNGLGQLTRVDAHANRQSKSRSRLYQPGRPFHRPDGKLCPTFVNTLLAVKILVSKQQVNDRSLV